MRFRNVWFLSFSFLILCVLAVSVSGNTVSDAKNYGFDVSIIPEQSNAGVYIAKFSVTDLTTGKIVVRPTLRFRAGDPISSSAVGESGVAFEFSVSIDEAASTAEYQVKVINGASIISSSQAKIALAK